MVYITYIFYSSIVIVIVMISCDKVHNFASRQSRRFGRSQSKVGDSRACTSDFSEI